MNALRVLRHVGFVILVQLMAGLSIHLFFPISFEGDPPGISRDAFSKYLVISYLVTAASFAFVASRVEASRARHVALVAGLYWLISVAVLLALGSHQVTVWLTYLLVVATEALIGLVVASVLRPGKPRPDATASNA